MNRLRRAVRAVFPPRAEWRSSSLPLLLCVLSGLAGGLIFQRTLLGALGWVALVPYFFALRILRGRMALWGTLLFGFVWHYLGLWWLNSLAFFNPFIPVGIAALAVECTVYLFVFAVAARFAWARLHPLAAPFAVAAAWAGCEYLRSLGELAFPWNLLGTSMSAFPEALQSADYWGVYGISFLMALACAMIACRIRSPRWCVPGLSCRPSMVSGALFLLLLGSALLPGNRVPTNGPASTPLSLALIQPNISQQDKWSAYDPETGDQKRLEIEAGMVRRQFDMMHSAASLGTTPTLIILPEAAIISPFFVYDTRLHELLRDEARTLGADILVGADRREEASVFTARARMAPGDPARGPRLPVLATRVNDQGLTESVEPGPMAAFASAWFVTPRDGLTSTVYDKMQLVPFGETAPYLDKIPFFQEKIMMVGSFQRGLDQTLFETSGTKFGVMICFESTFPHLARGIARRGGQFIAVITNDAWYDPSYLRGRGGIGGWIMALPVLRTLAAKGPDQHFVQSVFRAIETRLPVVRCANTGISAIIDPSGRVARSIPFGKSGIIAQDLQVPRDPKPTFYTRHGDWFAQACLVLTAALVVAEIIRRRRARASV